MKYQHALAKYSMILLTHLLVVDQVFAQSQLLKSFNVGSEYTLGSDPMNLLNFNNSLYFTADNDTKTKQQLLKIDGNEIKTVSVMNQRIYNIVSANNQLFFSGFDDAHGGELWKIDDNGQSILVKDISSGTASSNISHLTTNSNGVLYFVADDGIHGMELWKSDGTESGTVLVKDIQAGLPSAFMNDVTKFYIINGQVLFPADDGVHGVELWKSDGTETGTMLVKDISSNSSSLSTTTTFFGFNNDTVIFSADDGIHGKEPWKSDGTTAGTMLLKDIALGSVSSYGGAFDVVAFKNELYFPAFDGANGYELWNSDGTEAGTTLVTNIASGSASAGLQYLTVCGNYIFFSADDGVHNRQLWRSDGTGAGTILTKQISATDTALPQYLTDVNGVLFFSAVDGNHAQELWKSDGTELGTTLVKDISEGAGNSHPSFLIAVNGSLYFAADDGIHGDELWKSDGTTAGTAMVADFNLATASYPSYLIPAGNDLYFFVNQNPTTSELWKTNGTSSGTMKVKTMDHNSDAQNALSNVNNQLFLTNKDDVYGSELWISDGSESGTKLLKDIRQGSASSGAGNVSIPVTGVVNGNYFFCADDGVHGLELWKTDRTENGTVMVKDITPGADASNLNSATILDNTLYFFKDYELWKSDGNENGTTSVKVLNSTGSGWTPNNIINGDHVFYFIADDGVHGRELWKSDGTSAGTQMVKDIYSGTDPHYANIQGVLNGIVYLSANGSTNNVYNYELWRSDGTETGTFVVKEIAPGNTGSDPRSVGIYDNEIFFSANDAVHGVELWKSDGTNAGTVLVKDLNRGVPSSAPSKMFSTNDAFFFYATDSIKNVELWRVDKKKSDAGISIVEGANAPPAFNSELLNDVLIITTHNGTSHGNDVRVVDLSKVVTAVSPEEKQTVQVYPIPAKNYIHVDFPQTTGSSRIDLIDGYGRIIRTQMTNGEKSVIISTADVRRGLYIVSIQDGNNTYRCKVIIE